MNCFKCITFIFTLFVHDISPAMLHLILDEALYPMIATMCSGLPGDFIEVDSPNHESIVFALSYLKPYNLRYIVSQYNG